MLLSTQTVVVRPSPLTFICHYVFVSLPSTQNTWSAFLLVSTSISYHISTGAGIFVNTAVGTADVAFPNNGIVIARNVGGGDRFIFQCCSGSTNSSVGDIIGLDGNALPIDSSGAGVTTGGLNIRRDSPATVFIRNPVSEPAVDEGVYTCRIPDETGNDVDVNIGVYQNGFNSKSLHLPAMLYSIGSMYAHLLAHSIWAVGMHSI